MWFYIQTWLPLLTIALTAAIYFSVASFIMGQARPQASYSCKTDRLQTIGLKRRTSVFGALEPIRT
jgi:hypothetical protein